MINLDYYNPLTKRIIAAAQEVHYVLGPGYLESVYQRALEHELNLRGIPFVSQPHYSVPYKQIIAGEFASDLLCFDCVLVELKAIEQVNYDVIQAKAINYIHSAELEISLLLNFGKQSLEIKRYLLPEKLQ